MTEEEFLQIWSNPVPPRPVFYRAYYNEQGWVETYTMEDLPGNYIEIDQSTYTLAPRARVINGKLTVVRPADIVSKLVPGNHGTWCAPQDICIVVDQEPATKWSLKTNETN